MNDSFWDKVFEEDHQMYYVNDSTCIKIELNYEHDEVRYPII